jgi:hypothetical protein
MNLELAEQHKMIVEKSKELLKVILIQDKDLVTEIMNKSQSKIDNYNQKNLTIIDATKTEIGLFNSMVKRIIEGKYINPLVKSIIKPKDEDDFDYLCDLEEMQVIKYEDYEDDFYYDFNLFCDSCRKEYNERLKLCGEYKLKIETIISEFKNACSNTVFTDNLKSRKISLTRSIVVKHEPTEVQKILAKEIHKEVFFVFEQQNKDLLKKYNF